METFQFNSIFKSRIRLNHLGSITLLVYLLFSTQAFSQCLDAKNGQYPASTFTPTCDGNDMVITTAGAASQYSKINLTAGVSYTFKSNLATDWISISNQEGTLVLVDGLASVEFTPTEGGIYRFYTHSDASCGTDAHNRSRIIACTPPPACQNNSGFAFALAPTNNELATITSCAFAGEYGTIANAIAGESYTFESTGGYGNYITIRQGTYDGLVLGAGFSPVTVTCTTSGNLYMHVNTDKSCGSNSSCRKTTVKHNSSTGVESMDEIKFTLSPNPSSTGIFTLSSSFVTNNEPITVYDSCGKLIVTFEASGSEHTINLSKEPKGVYFLKFRNRIFKLIK